MKILTAPQVREADRRTIAEENISSGELMERAALSFTSWFISKFSAKEKNILICCGPGNNGGDGLAIARLLHRKSYRISIWIVSADNKFSPDFELNRQRLPQDIPVTLLTGATPVPALTAFAFIIDGLFGTGLSRPASGIFADVIAAVNQAPAVVVAIDVPSGLYTEKPNQPSDPITHARHTVSFAVPKLAFVLPQNEKYVGEWHLVPLDLSPAYLQEAPPAAWLLTWDQVANLLQARPRFAHKGTFGHALLLAGSYGKMGAAVLAARSCLRSGVGLLTIHSPRAGYTILQTAVPEAMTVTDPSETHLSQLPELNTYQAIGIGPGIGKEPATRALVRQLLQTNSAPLILDADALNILAEEPELLALLPPDSILTPHPKEFERLTGPAAHDYQRLELLQDFCEQHACYVVLKGRHTCIGTPHRMLYFNTTGNPGMATGGTGDVLTGIITALRAQQYTALDACRLGVYAHGLAGDLAKNKVGEMALVASDIVSNLAGAFLQLQQPLAIE